MPHIGPLADFGEPVLQQEDEAQEPRLFVRAITIRPAPPWDQARAARLEATLNAPVPLTQVALQLRRLEPWRPGAPGRYGAVYARHEDVRDGLTTTASLDGITFPVRFASPGRQREQARQLAIVGTLTAVGVFLLVTTAASVIATRIQATSRLEALELATAQRATRARSVSLRQAQAQALLEAGLDDRRASRVLEDLAWAARNRTANAGVEGFVWEGSLFAVEARGEEAPFSAIDRKVERASRPVRPGVWLLGVSDGAQATEPTP